MKPTKTSTSEPIVVDFLTRDRLQQPGQIGMSMAPGKHDEETEVIWQRDLPADLDRLRDHYKVDCLVCLLEADELHHLAIANLLTEAQARGIVTEHLPIPDEGLPESMAVFSSLVNQVVEAVKTGETVLIHCKGGRGRTGLLAAACLVQLGNAPEAAIETVREVRSGALSVALKRDYVYEFHTALQQ
ncbi:MAG: cyclin-dependent kinase inhibitor 3 family protein [Cyanobacteria bacterium P01_F01_bin.86]